VSQTPLAYRFVATEALVHRFNQYASRMHLPIEVPVKEADIRVLNVSEAPYQYRYHIRVKNYLLGLHDRALQFYKKDEYQSLNVSGMEKASRMPYVVNTNDTYRMATNWLTALDVDLVSLEKSNPPCVNRHPFFESERGPVPNPVLGVEWHNPTSPGYDSTEVSVEISAVSGDLIKLVDKTGDFSKRPALIQEVGKLLAISDEEFLKYSPLERSNLLVRFAGVHGPILSDALLFRNNALSHAK
jgi:hypothetical protein